MTSSSAPEAIGPESSGVMAPGLKTALAVLLALAVLAVNVSVAVSSIAMGTGLVLLVAAVAISRGRAFPSSPLDLFFAAYLLAEVLATIFSVDQAASLFNMKRFFQISIFYLVLAAYDNRKNLFRLLGSLIGVASAVSLVEVFSLTAVGGGFARVSMFQYFLTEGGIKMLSLLLVIPFVIHPGTPRRWRLWAAAAAAPLLAVLILTQTRSAWLGFLAGGIVIGVMRSRKMLVALVLLVALFALFAPQSFRDRAASIVDPTMTSNLTRIHMITTGWRMFLDRPLVGWGDIDLKKYYVTYTVPIDEAEGGHLHNNAMTLLVTLGAAGFLAAGAMFVRILLLEYRAARSTSDDWLLGSVTIGALAAYIGFHVNGLFEWNFGDHEIAVLLWFTVGLALVSARLQALSGAEEGPR
jgi:O-antigen ligase